MYLRITWTIEKSNSFVQFILHLVESTNIYSVRYICVMDMLQVSKYGLQRVKIIDIIQTFYMLDAYSNVFWYLITKISGPPCRTITIKTTHQVASFRAANFKFPPYLTWSKPCCTLQYCILLKKQYK